MQTELDTLSKVGVWGDVEKPWQDMAFLLIAPSIAAWCKKVFGLVAAWAHPHQPHYHTLEVVAYKLVLLADENADWPFIFIHLGDANPMHPYWVKDMSAPWWMVCPVWNAMAGSTSCRYANFAAQGHGGMPRRFEWWARSLPIYLTGTAPLKCCWSWQTCLQTTADRSRPQQYTTWEHNNCHSDSHYYTSATPSPADMFEPSWDITTAQINLHLRGALEWLQQASPVALASISWHSTPGKQLPLASLGALPSARGTEGPLRPEGTDSIIPASMATLQQTSPWVATPGGTPCFPHAMHPLLQLTILKTLQLQGKINMALEQLLQVRATMDFCCRELELNVECLAHLNDAQFTEAIKEAEVCHATTATALQQAHMNSVLTLECEAKVEVGLECQAFVEAYEVAIWGCQPKTQGTPLYPLQSWPAMCH